MDFSNLCGFLFGTIMLLSDVADGASVKLSPLHPIVREHTSLLLTCQYQGDGTVTSFAWYRSDYTDLKNPVASIRTDKCEPVVNMNLSKCELSCDNNDSSVWEIRDVTRELHTIKFECKAVVDKDVVVYSNAIWPTVNNPGTPYDPTDDAIVTSTIVVETASVYPRTTASVLTYITTPQDATISIYCRASNLPDRVPVISRTRIRFEIEETKKMDIWLILKCVVASMCVVLAVYSVCITVRMYRSCKKNNKDGKNTDNETVLNGGISDTRIAYSNHVAYASTSLVNKQSRPEMEHSGQYSTLTRSSNSVTEAYDTVNIDLYENIPTRILSLN